VTNSQSLLQLLQRLKDKHKTHAKMAKALGVGRNSIRNYYQKLHGLSWPVCGRLSNEIDEPIDKVLQAAGHEDFAAALVARFGQPLLTEAERYIVDGLRQVDPPVKAAIRTIIESNKKTQRGRPPRGKR
jgi:hypothetical protein